MSAGGTHEAIGAALEQATIFRACFVAGGRGRVIALGRGVAVSEHDTFCAAQALAQRLTRRARGRAALAAMRKLGAAP